MLGKLLGGLGGGVPAQEAATSQQPYPAAASAQSGAGDGDAPMLQETAASSATGNTAALVAPSLSALSGGPYTAAPGPQSFITSAAGGTPLLPPPPLQQPEVAMLGSGAAALPVDGGSALCGRGNKPNAPRSSSPRLVAAAACPLADAHVASSSGTPALAGSPSLLDTPAVVAEQGAAADGGVGAGGGDDGGAEGGEPALARDLGVTLASLDRLFRSNGKRDFEQPVWMVVNLQGKIKGSYAADKMVEFVRRGTLSARQLVLGIDRDLPYILRQELGFYRPLGDLAVAIHNGARYNPLSAANALATGASPWEPVAPGGADDGASSAADRSSLPGSSSETEGAQAADTGGGGAGDGDSDAQLRAALHRLFAPDGEQEGAVAPMWLYINHLGWCRG